MRRKKRKEASQRLGMNYLVFPCGAVMEVTKESADKMGLGSGSWMVVFTSFGAARWARPILNENPAPCLDGCPRPEARDAPIAWIPGATEDKRYATVRCRVSGRVTNTEK